MPAGMNTRICTNIGQMLRRVTAAMPFHSTFTTPETRHTTAPATKERAVQQAARPHG